MTNSEDLTTGVARIVIGCEEIWVFAFGEGELVLSDGSGPVILAGYGLVKRVVRSDRTELLARDDVAEYGVSAAEYRKR